MKKFILVLIASILFSVTVLAQSSGDYTSIGSGNWNDPTKWTLFDGANWVSTTTYPGQNPGTGDVTISAFDVMTLTVSVPHPVGNLWIQYYFDEYWSYDIYGYLLFSAENAVSLTVSGNINNSGELRVEDHLAAKSHKLFIGGSLYGNVNGISGDDKVDVIFNSTVPVSFITSWGTFHDVTFNGNIFTIETSMTIYGHVTFMNGIVNTNQQGTPNYGNLHFKKGATWSGASNILYVDAWVGKEGDEPFTFPIGNNGVYAPLTISAPVGQTELFLARYKRESGSALGGITDPGLSNISQCEYWNLVPGNGEYTKNYPLSITVGWEASRACGISQYITNVGDVTLAHFNGSSWNSHGGTATGTSENGFVTWSGVTTFSPFTFGNIGTCKTPSGLNTTNITGSSATVSWSPESGAVSYNVYYNESPYGLTSAWQNAAIGTTLTSVNLSGLNQATKYYYRIRANCSSATSSDRQSEFTTLKVCEQPTGLMTTMVTSVSATFNWAPLPGATSYHIEYEHFSTWTPVNEVITSTSYTLGGLIPGSYYRWRVRANCPLGSSHYQYSGLFYTYYSLCEGPTGLTTTNITNNSATLTWTAITNASNYYVDYKQSTSTTWITLPIWTTSLSYALSGLSASTEYNWRVLANCSGNYAQASFTTASLPPCSDIYESNNTSGQAKTISIGSTISAGISSANDVDWFKVTTPSDPYTILQVDLMNLPADYDLYVYNKSLKLIGSSINSGNSNEVVVYNSNARKATYYIKVIPKNGAYNAGCYSLMVRAFYDGHGNASHASAPPNEVTEGLNKQFLYPNPATEFVYLNFNSATEGSVNIHIVNSIGQLVKQHPVKTIKGNNQFKIQVADIRPGMYILRINKEELNMIRKFVISR